MGFFMRMQNSLRQFMSGRYGQDKLGFVLIIAWMAVAAINLFFHSWVIYLLGLALAGWALFRMLSRNIPKRMAENERYLRLEGTVRQKCRLYRRMWRERKTHRFYKCPACRAVIRIPRRKGKVTVRCTHCGQFFDKTVR